MTIRDIKNKVLNGDEYKFIWNDKHKPILIGLGGSWAYGTNTDHSDIDVRGISLNTKEELLTNQNFEQLINNETDTTIYGFNKMIHLLSDCNPNTIEILGLRPEHYLYVSVYGRALLNNKKIFLSKRCIHTFGSYASAQLRRMSNKAVRLVGQEEQEQHILHSVESAKYTFTEKYFTYPDDAINIYVDKAMNPDMDTEIFMDVNLKHYPLRDYRGMWSEMQNIVKDYSKIGKRNKHAIEHEKLGKHMMHLVRLYLMAIDLLEKEEIVTYRDKEHDLLMSIRNEEYLDSNYQPIPEFYEMVNELEKRFDYAKENTSLPKQPNYKAINELMMAVNETVIKVENGECIELPIYTQ